MNKLTNYSEVKFVNPAQISKHLECSICTTFYCQPLRLSCGHTFCTECYRGLRNTVQNGQQFRCPLCRENIDLRYVFQDKLAQNLLEEQQVYCLNKDKYCIWKGPLYELEKHVESCKFKEHDEMSQNLIMHFDKNIQEQAKNSNLNTHLYNQTFLDDKLQENLNKNVGEQLLVRLMNKDKNLAQQIARSISVKEDSKSSTYTNKKSPEEKPVVNNQGAMENFDDDDEEEEYKQKDDIDLDNLDDVFQMFSDNEKDTKESQNSQPNAASDSQQTAKKAPQKGRRKSKQKSKGEDDEDFVPGKQQQKRRGNKKRPFQVDIDPEVELQQKLYLYQQFGIDIDEIV